MDVATRIPADITVNELVAREPATLAVFRKFGIDTCCGGAVSLAAAAVRDGIDYDELMRQLVVALEA